MATAIVLLVIAYALAASCQVSAALESYERRGEWGLTYPIKIEVAAPR